MPHGATPGTPAPGAPVAAPGSGGTARHRAGAPADLRGQRGGAGITGWPGMKYSMSWSPPARSGNRPAGLTGPAGRRSARGAGASGSA